MAATRWLLRATLRATGKPLLGPHIPIGMQRALLPIAGVLGRPARGLRIEPIQLDGVRVEKITPANAADDVAIVYLHGGGYCIGSPRSHRALTTHLAARSGLAVLAVDYRLAPEHPAPAALDDAVRVCCALRAQGVEHFVLGGDSAGGGLALATAHVLRDAGAAQPRGLLLVSPFSDLSGQLTQSNPAEAHDPMLSHAGLQRWAQTYCRELPLDDARVSPLRGVQSGLPPALILAGSDEVLLADSEQLAADLRAAGNSVNLRIEPGLWHVYPLHAGLLAEADSAVARMAAFALELLQGRISGRAAAALEISVVPRAGIRRGRCAQRLESNQGQIAISDRPRDSGV